MKESFASIGRRGQITVPTEVWQALGLKHGDKVALRVEANRVTITPANSSIAASYQVVPPLDPPLPWKEIERIAHEEAADEVLKEGLSR